MVYNSHYVETLAIQIGIRLLYLVHTTVTEFYPGLYTNIKKEKKGKEEEEENKNKEEKKQGTQ
jgi:hypothetical protein